MVRFGYWLAFAAVLCALAYISVLYAPAYAHDMYQDWKMPTSPNVSCCHDKDCRAVKAYQDDEGQWWAFHEETDKYIPVPHPTSLGEDYAKDGRSHLCASAWGTVYCFTYGQVRI